MRAPERVLRRLRARGWRFYTFIGGGAPFMFAWDSEPGRVGQLAADIRRACMDARSGEVAAELWAGG